MIRLNKLLADRGLGARRKCDDLIAEGRVRVNGRLVTEPGTKVEEDRDRVEVNGRPLPARGEKRYFVLNKPVGVITTMQDPEGRRTIASFLPPGGRLYPVGRLDADTSGLLMLTNDGELAHRLMHPRYGVAKVYRVRLDREPTPRQLDRLARGVEFEPGVVSSPARVRRISPGFDAIMIEVSIHEGRHRQVRRMCEAVGLEVTGLHRVAYGPVRLGPLARGMWRELSEDEVARLRSASARPQKRGARTQPAKPARSPRPAASARPAPDSELAEFEDRRWSARIGDDDAAEWPRRPDGRRGDADFTGSAPARKGRPAVRADRAAGRRSAPGGPSGPRATRGAKRDAERPRRSSGPRAGRGVGRPAEPLRGPGERPRRSAPGGPSSTIRGRFARSRSTEGPRAGVAGRPDRRGGRPARPERSAPQERRGPRANAGKRRGPGVRSRRPKR